jgi:hypothetical protein
MPLPEPKPRRVQAPADQGIGLCIPPRESDCSGVRPSWYPFVFNVCDCDGPSPMPWTERMMRVPPAPVS